MWYNIGMLKNECEKALEDRKTDFEKLYGLLVEKNKLFNLTSITEEKEVYAKHFYDSVYPSFIFSDNAKIVEVGSGGGFPSVPLKIVKRGLDFTLIEATNKKCVYLNEVKNEFCFENFKVLNGRAEELAKTELRESFDYAVARAVAPMRTLLEYLLPFVKTGGKAVCYKSGDYKEELESAKNAMQILGGEIEDVYEYELPFNSGKRSAIVIKKIKNTPLKYPRGMGKEKKCPL